MRQLAQLAEPLNRDDEIAGRTLIMRPAYIRRGVTEPAVTARILGTIRNGEFVIVTALRDDDEEWVQFYRRSQVVAVGDHFILDERR